MQKLANIEMFEQLGQSHNIVCDLSCFNAVATATAAPAGDPGGRITCSVRQVKPYVDKMGKCIRTLIDLTDDIQDQNMFDSFTDIIDDICINLSNIVKQYEAVLKGKSNWTSFPKINS